MMMMMIRRQFLKRISNFAVAAAAASHAFSYSPAPNRVFNGLFTTKVAALALGHRYAME